MPRFLAAASSELSSWESALAPPSSDGLRGTSGSWISGGGLITQSGREMEMADQIRNFINHIDSTPEVVFVVDEINTRAVKKMGGEKRDEMCGNTLKFIRQSA